jgi:hypothetical protein
MGFYVKLKNGETVVAVSHSNIKKTVEMLII